MRLSLLAIASLAAAAACSSGTTRVIYLPTPTPTAQPEPVEQLLPPVGITIVDTAGGRMLVSTNQQAYVAIFEIVPNGGVSLIYPTSARQRQVAFAGSNSVAVRWDRARARGGDGDDQRRNARARDRAAVHYLYAIASARPFSFGNDAFDADGLRATLGTRAYRAIDPYATMDALAHRFVPVQLEEDWGEDVFAIDRSRQREQVRYATVYCPDGRVIRVRDELADRTTCPASGRGAGTTGRVAHPDSTVGSNGRRIAVGAAVRRGPPLHRVERPGSAGGNGNGDNSGGDGAATNGSTLWKRVQPQGATRMSPHDATSTAKPEPMPKAEAKPDSAAAAKPAHDVKPDSASAAKPAAASAPKAGGPVWQRAAAAAARAKADSAAADSTRAGKP